MFLDSRSHLAFNLHTYGEQWEAFRCSFQQLYLFPWQLLGIARVVACSCSSLQGRWWNEPLVPADVLEKTRATWRQDGERCMCQRLSAFNKPALVYNKPDKVLTRLIPVSRVGLRGCRRHTDDLSASHRRVCERIDLGNGVGVAQ